MSEKDFNYKVTQTFYAKWILPFVLIALGVVFLVIFFNSLNFFEDRNGKIYYNNTGTIIGVEDLHIYEKGQKGSYEVYNDTGTIYNDDIPKYHEWKANLSTIGVVSGIAFCAIGISMLLINSVKAIATVKTKKTEHEEE